MPENEIQCSQCGKPFERQDPVACISGRIMGDQCTDVYYWCAVCSVYTIRLYRDVFVGPETARDSDPISKEEGDRRLEIIRRCATLEDERCRCEAHLEYFGGWLD